MFLSRTPSVTSTSRGIMEKYNVQNIKEELQRWDNGKYYGQWETDRVIEEYFPAGHIGLCVEVGAANGVKGSNTLYFEEREWDVLCIEPNPEHKISLEKYRKWIRYFACGDKPGTFPLTVYKVGEKNISSSLTSLRPDNRLVEAHKDIINDSYQTEVRVETLTHILQKETEDTPFMNQKEIDFISIDTEGTELDVLKGFDFDEYRVKLFVIENNYEDTNIEDYMRSKGYLKRQRYKINEFYTPTKERAK